MQNGFLPYFIATNRRNNLRWRVPSAMLAGIALLFPFQGFSRADDDHDHEATAITDCSTVINNAGRYFIANDLKMCQDFGVSITVSDVKLELRGHTIQGPSIKSGLINADGGDTGLSNIEIEGPGTVAGGTTGICFQNVQHSQVNNLVVVGNSFGIVAAGSIKDVNVSLCGSMVKAADFESVPPIPGISSDDNEFRDNVVAGQMVDGVFVFGSKQNRFIHNNLSANGGDGLHLLASNNIVSHNTVDSNVGIGILVVIPGNIIEDNTALGNFVDLQDGSGVCTNNTWTNNSINSPFGCN
jgi:parallel beta-helix repeat protein